MIMKKTIIAGLIILLMILSFLFFFNVFLPAKGSYNSVCNPELVVGQYTVLGSTISNYDDNGTLTDTTITLSEDVEFGSDLYFEIYQHENCHRIQSERSYKWISCDYPLLKLLSEMECYTVEGLPSGIYRFFY